MLKKLATLPKGLNVPATFLADTCYYSEANVAACHQAKIATPIGIKREGHHPHWRKRFTVPEPLAADASPEERMK
jgi:hypothetical protein